MCKHHVAKIPYELGRLSQDLAGGLVYRFLSTWLSRDGSVANRTPWNCSEVFARLEGKWKIILTHWSLIRGKRM